MMSARIDALALQATDSSGALDYHKFANLILGDCINTIKESAGSHLKSDATEYDLKEIDLKVAGALDAMIAVSEHFGS